VDAGIPSAELFALTDATTQLSPACVGRHFFPPEQHSETTNVYELFMVVLFGLYGSRYPMK
jgi:hypothetical protein